MRRHHQVFLTLLIALLAGWLPTAVAMGQELAQFPNTFYGNATNNGGQLAPPGTVVTAVVDRGVIGSEMRYSLAVTELGRYGTANGLKLKVGGDSELRGAISDGSNIEFFLSIGSLPDDTNGIEPVREFPFVEDGTPQVRELDLTGTILGLDVTPTPTAAPTSTPTGSGTGGGSDNDNDNDRAPISTPTPPTPAATLEPDTSTDSLQGGGGGGPTPTPTPVLVPPTEPVDPTPIVVVLAPPQVPTATPEPTPPPPTLTVESPTPTVSLVIDETIGGGGGEAGGFPWWGWALIILGVGAATGGLAIYYLRSQGVGQ